MAGKKPAKPEKDRKPAGKGDGAGGGGIMALIPKIMGAVSVTAGAVLLAGLYDVGHLGLVHVLEGFAVFLVPLYLAGALAAIFMGGKTVAPGAGGEGAEGGLAEQLQELQAKVNARLSSFQSTLDVVTGQDYEKILAENKELRAQLDAIRAAEKEQIDQQVEMLRAKNAELEEQIRKWAIQSVENAINGEGGGDNGDSVNVAA